MGGLPLAIGAKAVSSYPISSPSPIEEFADDGTVLVPVIIPHDNDFAEKTIVFLALNSQEIQATIALSYYDMLRLDNGDCEYSLAEFRIQISPAGESFSTFYRESIHRIRLPAGNSFLVPTKAKDSLQQQSILFPKAIFSNDQRYLTCLIPHSPPFGTYKLHYSDNTSVVVFQLRKPKASHIPQKYPVLPSYIQDFQTTKDDKLTKKVIPIATNPRILGFPQNSCNNEKHISLLDVCSICDAKTKVETVGPSCLLLGRRNGTLMSATYKTLSVLTVLNDRNVENNTDNSIVFMDHLTEWDVEEAIVGRLVIIYKNGLTVTFRSEIKFLSKSKDYETNHENSSVFDSFTNLENFTFQTEITNNVNDYIVFLTKSHEVKINNDNNNNYNHIFTTAKWIAGSYLALAHKPDSSKFIIQVLGLCDRDRCTTVSTLETSIDQLIENAHTCYSIAVEDHSSMKKGYRNQRSRNSSGQLFDMEPGVSIDYDLNSDCLAISGCLLFSKEARKPFNFGCIWNWRSNVLGLTIVPFLEGAKTQIPFVRTQHLTFGKDINAERKLSHIITWYSTEGDIRIRKEIYTLGSLSPPREIPFRGGTLRKTYNLFLSNATVCFPWPTRVSTQANFEIEWIESIIPRSFVVACGSPLIATIGSQIGRSIAVAASRGVCILDCSDRFQANHSVQRVSASSGDDRLFKLRPYVFPHRWCLFGNVTEEATFRVVAMSWWESSVLNSFGMDPIMSDDILIALIEVYGDCAGLYLACWSSRNLSLDGQLLSPSSIYSQESKQSQWGIVMPNGFQPSSLDILIQPNHDSIQGSVPMSARKASVLLTDCTYETKFMVYNIQTIKHVVNLKKSSKLRKYYDIIGWQAANGSIGSPADLFLVSASFICDSNEKVEERSVHENHPTSISTIGILRKYGGGLDAILVSNSSVTAFGSVLFSADTNPHNEQYSDISRIWLGDIVRREKLFTNESQLDCFVWILQLTNGKLFSWFVPFVSNNEDFHFLMRPSKIDDNYDYALGCYRVHTKGISLGLVCNAGTTSNWMQISSKGTRYDLLLGHVPKSFFGYAIGVSQSCKKLHRSLGEDFEKQIFRSDFLDHEVFCPGDFELYPPEFLPSLYSLFRGTAAATVKSNFNLPDFDDHLGQRLSNLPYQQTVSLMTVQLMILRCVEMIASLVNKNGNGVNLFSVEQCMLSLLVNTVRLHTTSLQFANLFLQLGRQLEPSCLQHLFPLPGSSTFRPEGYESTAWMLAKVLEEGSSRMATTALPLLGDRNTTKTTCAAIFRHCLLILDEGLDSRSSFDFNFPYEEKFAIGDVFRFVLKISMPDMDFESDTEFDDETPQTTYSIFCRMPFFPRRSQNLKKKSAQISSLMLSNFPNSLLKGEDVFNMIPTIEEDNHCAALIFTRYILSVIVEDNGYKTKRCWNKIAAFAFLLVGDTTSGFRMCTKEDFGQLVRHFVNLELCNVLSSFLKVFILHCSNHLEPDIASRIFDLLLLLLGSASADLETEIPDLLLLAVVVGHTSERIIEILSDEPNESHLWTSYNSVRFELSV